jgi:hypothetical protein
MSETNTDRSQAYFHGETGAAIGAIHQSGRIGLVTNLLLQSDEYHRNSPWVS